MKASKILEVLRLPDRLFIRTKKVRGYVAWPRKESLACIERPVVDDLIEWNAKTARWSQLRASGSPKLMPHPLRIIKAHAMALLVLTGLVLGATPPPRLPAAQPTSKLAVALKRMQLRHRPAPRQIVRHPNAVMAMTASSRVMSQAVILPPPIPTITAFWNPEPAATGFVLIGKYNGVRCLAWDVGNVTSATIHAPGGFALSWSLEAYNGTHKRQYSLPTPEVIHSAYLPTNVLQYLKWGTNFSVMAQLTSNGRLLTSTNLVNWTPYGSIPANTPTLFAGSTLLTPKLFFETVSP